MSTGITEYKGTVQKEDFELITSLLLQKVQSPNLKSHQRNVPHVNKGYLLVD